MEEENKMLVGLGAIALVTLAIMVWLWRPLHTIAMLFYETRAIWFILFASVLAGLYMKIVKRESFVVFTIIGFFIAIIIIPPISYSITEPITMTNINHHQIQPNSVNIDEIPPFDNTIRVIPLRVAEATFLKSLTEPRYTVERPEITRYNGEDTWVSELSPDGVINVFTKNSLGFMVMDFNSTRVQKIKFPVKCSPTMEYFDNIYYILERHIFWAEYDKPIPYITPEKHEWVVPIIKYHQHILYAEPYWAGIATVDMETCKVTYYPRDKIPQEYYALPIFPESLAETYANAFAWWKDSAFSNAMNILFHHENQTEFHEYRMYNDVDLGNGQPFFVRTADGQARWFIALEPHGRSYGIKKVLMIDQKGKILVKSFNSPVIGVEAAITAVRNALPRFDWEEFQITEPIPVQKDTRLYWRLVVTPNDSSTISKIALVPMKSGAVTADEVIVFDTIQEYEKFLNEGQLPTKPPEEPGAPVEVNGTVLHVINYDINGTTHFAIELDTTNGTVVIDIPATCLTPEEIIEISKMAENPGMNETFIKEGNCWKPAS